VAAGDRPEQIKAAGRRDLKTAPGRNPASSPRRQSDARWGQRKTPGGSNHRGPSKAPCPALAMPQPPPIAQAKSILAAKKSARRSAIGRTGPNLRLIRAANRFLAPRWAAMIEASEWRAVAKNTLQGFCVLSLSPSGLVLRDCALHERDGKRWVSLPSKPQIDADGRQRKTRHRQGRFGLRSSKSKAKPSGRDSKTPHWPRSTSCLAARNERLRAHILAKIGGPLTKQIALDVDGSLKSDGSACVMPSGVARRFAFDTASELARRSGS